MTNPDHDGEPILFYTPGACSLACAVALEWGRVPYRLCRVEKEVRAGALYRRIHPRAQVPALRVGGSVLLETNAILAHIADRVPPGTLLPAHGSWERDQANQWLAYLGSGFHPAFWPYFLPERYVDGTELHGAVKQAAVQAIARELRLIDTHLASNPYLLGAERSALDPYLHAMDRWANKLVDLPGDYPNVWRHQKALARDPAVRLVVALERGEVPVVEQAAYRGHVELTDLLS